MCIYFVRSGASIALLGSHLKPAPCRLRYIRHLPLYTGTGLLYPCIWQNCPSGEWQFPFCVMIGERFKICLMLTITGFTWFPASRLGLSSCQAVLTQQKVSRQRAKMTGMHKQLAGSLTPRHFPEIWK